MIVKDSDNNDHHFNDKKDDAYQFICEKCGEGFNQRSRIKRHMETSHPPSAPSAADVEKILAGIDYPSTKEEVVNYTKQKVEGISSSSLSPSLSSSNDMKLHDLLNLIQSLPTRNYRDSAEIAKALGEIKSRKGVKSKEEAEGEEQPSKKGGRVSATSSVSAASIAKVLSGIDFPKSKKEIQEYAKRNMSSIMEIEEEEGEEKKNKVGIPKEGILDILDKIKSGNYYSMADVEQEIGKLL